MQFNAYSTIDIHIFKIASDLTGKPCYNTKVQKYKWHETKPPTIIAEVHVNKII